MICQGLWTTPGAERAVGMLKTETEILIWKIKENSKIQDPRKIVEKLRNIKVWHS